MSSQTLRISTRGSKLALWQAEWVAAQIRAAHPNISVELVIVSTVGDRDRETPLATMGSVGVFTKEIQRAVLDGRADLAVHSMKDLPILPADGLTLAAVPPRENPADALVTGNGADLLRLPSRARVGTSSPRRRAMLKHARPDLEVVEIRGNVETRLAQVREGRLDAVVLAAAGLTRLGLNSQSITLLSEPQFLPAPAQGALAVECRSDDPIAREALHSLNHPESRSAANAERALLAALGGGCGLALGTWARRLESAWTLTACALDPEGLRRIDVTAGPAPDPLALANQAADALRAAGVDHLLRGRD